MMIDFVMRASLGRLWICLLERLVVFVVMRFSCDRIQIAKSLLGCRHGVLLHRGYRMGRSVSDDDDNNCKSKNTKQS